MFIYVYTIYISVYAHAQCALHTRTSIRINGRICTTVNVHFHANPYTDYIIIIILTSLDTRFKLSNPTTI